MVEQRKIEEEASTVVLQLRMLLSRMNKENDCRERTGAIMMCMNETRDYVGMMKVG